MEPFQKRPSCRVELVEGQGTLIEAWEASHQVVFVGTFQCGKSEAKKIWELYKTASYPGRCR